MSTSARVVGVGETEYRKRIDRSAETLACEAVVAAARDAGIDVTEVDGIIGYPGHVAPETVMATLGMRSVKFRTSINLGGASAVAGLQSAAMAIGSGVAKYVLLYRALKGSSGPRKHLRPSAAPGSEKKQHLEMTAGLNTPAQRYSLLCRRYMYEFGLQRLHLAEIALATRAHANMNPNAQMHDRTLDLETYLGGRKIADPYSLFDCSLETDGACAVIVGPSRNNSRDVLIAAVADGSPPQPDDIPSRSPFLEVGLSSAARDVWEETGYQPSDMDAAMIYDCFTFEVVHQLEAAGFAQGDALFRLIEDGGLRLGGRLPLNTHGGLLSEAHMAGLNHIIEATRQLRGECGARQVVGAERVAVSGWGNFGDGTFAVLEASGA